LRHLIGCETVAIRLVQQDCVALELLDPQPQVREIADKLIAKVGGE
jgi:hypothetical protein